MTQRKHIVASAATSGLAALSLMCGTTIHKCFDLPVVEESERVTSRLSGISTLPFGGNVKSFKASHTDSAGTDSDEAAKAAVRHCLLLFFGGEGSF